MKNAQRRTGITRAPLPREKQEQNLVPPRGKSAIGKGRNRKAKSPAARRKSKSR